MDWVKIAYSVILLICGILIVAASLKKGDERKRFIHMKAQSYAFIVVIGMLILEVGKSIYLTIEGNHSDNGFSPIMFLSVISIIYVVTLLIYRRKYGD